MEDYPNGRGSKWYSNKFPDVKAIPHTFLVRDDLEEEWTAAGGQ